MIAAAIIAIILFPAPLWCWDNEPTVPMIRTVDPVKAKAGATVLVEGDALNAPRVVELYMTQGETDLKVEILSQTKTQIKFKVPADMAAARYSLTVMTGGNLPQLLVQPVFLTVVK
jgi:hypothetical protein